MKSVATTLLVLLVHASIPSFSQDVWMTRNGKISFFSRTPMENIDAVNNEVLGVMDLKKGEIAFAVLIKGFHFERALMEEHFNENYMESTKFPKATFNGAIKNLGTIDFKRDGSYPIQVEGDLTIHGVTKKMAMAGELIVKDGKLSSKSSFKIIPKDFNIAIPTVVAEKIAEAMDVSVECTYQPKQ